MTRKLDLLQCGDDLPGKSEDTILVLQLAGRIMSRKSTATVANGGRVIGLKGADWWIHHPSRVCTEKTDGAQRLFNDPDVSTSVDVRAGGYAVAGGKQKMINRYDPTNTKHCIKVH